MTSQNSQAEEANRSLLTFFDFLRDQGCDPHWSLPRGNGYKRIICRRGSIRSIDFLANVMAGFFDIGPGELVGAAMSFNLFPEYGGRPGLDKLDIKKTVGVGWVGNDMGLGIIDRLNGDDSLNTALSGKPNVSITAERIGDQARVYGGWMGDFARKQGIVHEWREWRVKRRLNLHSLEDRYLAIPYSWELTRYSRFDPWQGRLPGRDLWESLISIARHLLYDSGGWPEDEKMNRLSLREPETNLGKGPPSTSNANTAVGRALKGPNPLQDDLPMINVVALAVIPLFLIFGIMWIGRWPLAALWRRFKLEDRLSGTKQVNGVLFRKWVTTSSEDPTGKHGKCYIRVGDLPFKVAEETHDSLTTGDSVMVTYWRRSKRIDSVNKVG